MRHRQELINVLGSNSAAKMASATKTASATRANSVTKTLAKPLRSLDPKATKLTAKVQAAQTSDAWVAVGRFGKSYGLNGWLWLRSLNDQENHLLDLQPWFLKASGTGAELVNANVASSSTKDTDFATSNAANDNKASKRAVLSNARGGAEASYQRLELVAFSWSSDHKALRVQLATVNSEVEAKKLTNQLIYVPRSQLPKLNLGEYYWQDLVGLKVYGLDGYLGTVSELFSVGPHDVMVVKAPLAAKPCLIPFVEEVVKTVDVAGGLIKVLWRRDYL